MTSHAICHTPPGCESPLCPAHPHCVHHLPSSRLVAYSVIRLTVAVPQCLMFEEPLFYLKMTPKHKNNDADNSDTPKRSCKLYHSLRYSIYGVQHYPRFQASIHWGAWNIPLWTTVWVLKPRTLVCGLRRLSRVRGKSPGGGGI